MALVAPNHQKEPRHLVSMNIPTRNVAMRKADPEQVIQRYAELRNLERTGQEFGITRERVRQIVNRAGIATGRQLKPKAEKRARLCKECGDPVASPHSLYCSTHRLEKHKRRYRAIKADPVKYAHWRDLLKKYDRRRKSRGRDQEESALSA